MAIVIVDSPLPAPQWHWQGCWQVQEHGEGLGRFAEDRGLRVGLVGLGGEVGASGFMFEGPPRWERIYPLWLGQRVGPWPPPSAQGPARVVAGMRGRVCVEIARAAAGLRSVELIGVRVDGPSEGEQRRWVEQVWVWARGLAGTSEKAGVVWIEGARAWARAGGIKVWGVMRGWLEG